jgi:hypothetical protein
LIHHLFIYKKDAMAIIHIEDGTNADDIECIFHALSKNTWSIAGGATATLMPVDAGTWSSQWMALIEGLEGVGKAEQALTLRPPRF